MERLHWHTAANPCLLCGVEVTPENWAGPGGPFDFPVYGRGLLEALPNTGHPGYWTCFDSGSPAFGFGIHTTFYTGPRNVLQRARPLFPFGIHTTFYTGPRNVLQHTRPLFPPLGWAGKSDEELWAAMGGRDGIDLCTVAGGVATVSYHPEYGVRVITSQSFTIADPDGFCQAIRNAGLLHKRLMEEEIQEAAAGE